MKTVVYSCPFVPAEWIAAHGLRPSRFAPLAGAKTVNPPGTGIGVCPYAQAFINEVRSGAHADAVVLTTTCDQMRRASEPIGESCRAPVFLFHVPTTWQTVAAQKHYVDELKRLGRFLIECGGEAPSNGGLAQVMDAFETARSQLHAARGRLSARQFSQAMASLHRNGEIACEPDGPEPALGGVPIALVGGPLLPRHLDLFDYVRKARGNVVLDATTTGERSMPAPFDRRALRDDPLSTLANAYFGQIPDAFRRPNSQLYVWLKARFAERGVRGVLFHHYIWCDTWHAEAQRMKEWTDLPFLTLVSGDEGEINGHAISRIQSFLEMVK